MKQSLLWIFVFFTIFVSGGSVSHAQIKIKRIRWTPPKVKTQLPKAFPLPRVTLPGVKIKDPFGNIQTALEKAGKDFTTTIRKAGTDTGNELARTAKHLNEASVAVVNYTRRQANGYGESLSDAEKRIRQGKVADGLFHLALDPQLNTEKNMSLATQESKLVNQAGTLAASAYGGPGGAAAYAAWSTYRKTGDADLAFRAAVIVGMSSGGYAAAQGIPGDAFGRIVQRAVISGAVGGLAVAASGGGEDAVKRGFLMAGGMVLIQDGYREYVGHDLDPTGAAKEPYCMKAVPHITYGCAPPENAYIRGESGEVVFDSKGNPRIDFTKLDPKRSYVGKWSKPGVPVSFAEDNSLFMRSVAKVPGMNAMGLFHDKWAVSWDMNQFNTAWTIAPAIVLTYLGTEAPINSEVTEALLNAQAERSRSNAPSATSPTADLSKITEPEIIHEKPDDPEEDADIVVCYIDNRAIVSIVDDELGSYTEVMWDINNYTKRDRLYTFALYKKTPWEVAQWFLKTPGWTCYSNLDPASLITLDR